MTSKTFFLLSLLAFVATLVVAAVSLPDRVPMHFDVSGAVDRWAGRGEALVTLGLVGAGMAALFGGIAAGIDRLPLRLINVPHKDWWSATPERQQVLRSRLRTDLFVIGGATLLLLGGIQLLMVRAAGLDEPHLDAWFWVLLGTYLAVVAVATAYAIRVRYRRDGS